MSFDSSKLQQQTQFAMVNNGLPGIFTYVSSTDNLSTILTNGYFPANILMGWIGAGDFIEIYATDGGILKYFDSSFYLNDVVQFPSNTMAVSTITAASGNLSINTFYIFNNTQNGSYNLPTAIGNGGKEIIFKKISSAILDCTINGTSGQTIDGLNSMTLSLLNSKSRIISDNENWFIIG